MKYNYEKLFIALLLTKMLCANAAGDGMVVADAGVSGGKLYEYKNFPLHLFRQETFMCGFLRIILHRKIRCCVYARRADAF